LLVAVNFVIRLRAISAFPNGFGEIVRQTFVNVTGISNSRVSEITKKRSTAQLGDLETELSVAPGIDIHDHIVINVLRFSQILITKSRPHNK